MTPWEQQIEDDLSWRMEELATLKVQVLAQRKDSQAYRSLLRALFIMLYAHYEGFCRFVLSVYLDRIEKSRVSRRDCLDVIAKFSLRREVRVANTSQSISDVYDFVVLSMEKMLAQVVVFEVDNKTSEYKLLGESNLYPSMLLENCCCLGLPHIEISSNETRLRALVSRRNDIAHGRQKTIRDLSEYQEFENAAYRVMLELAISVNGSIDEFKFMKPVSEYEI